MSRARLQKREVLIGKIPDVLRQLPIMQPELWGGEVLQKPKTGTGQMSEFVTMTAAANLNHGKYQRIDRSPAAVSTSQSAKSAT